MIVTILSTVFIACKKDIISQEENEEPFENTEIQNDYSEELFVHLKFDGNNENDTTSIYVEAEIISSDPIRLKSEELLEVVVYNSVTKEKLIGYILKSTSVLKYTIKYCYVLNGRCFEYGKLLIDDYGTYIFIPCTGLTQILHPDICPKTGELYAK